MIYSTRQFKAFKFRKLQDAIWYFETNEHNQIKIVTFQKTFVNRFNLADKNTN